MRKGSDSFTILGLWVLGLAVSNESQLQTYESKTLFLMTSLQYYYILGLAEIKTYAQKMQDAQVTKSLKGYETISLSDDFMEHRQTVQSHSRSPIM